MSAVPSVSVVLPTFNRAAALARSIGSVLAQTHDDLELIVVDDGSTDDTAAVVAALDDPRVRYVHLGHRAGVSVARNRGVALARGAWVAFQDSDDRWLPERLARQMAAGQERVALIVTRDHVVNDPALSYRDVAAAAGEVVDVTDLARYRLPPAATWLARRDALLATGGFDAHLDCYEDWELGLRLRQWGRLLLVNHVLVERERSAGSLFSDEASRLRNLARIVERHAETLREDRRAWSYYCNALGQMQMLQSGDATAARRWFGRALRARPHDGRAWANLAVSWCGRAAFARYVLSARALRGLGGPL